MGIACGTFKKGGRASYLLIAILYVFAVSHVSAQDYIINTTGWGVNDGLSHREVNGIFKDRQGFMWVGTPNGLNRFDGYSFKVYNTQNTGLPFNDFIGITQDDEGNIWLLSPNAGNNISILNPFTERALPLPANLPRQADYLAGTRNGTIILSYQKGGKFYTYSHAKGTKSYKTQVKEHSRFCGISEKETLWFTDRKTVFAEYDTNGILLKQVNTLGNLVPDRMNDFDAGSGLSFFYNSSKNPNFYLLDKSGNIRLIDYTPVPSEYKDAVFYSGLDDLVWRKGRVYTRGKGLIYTVPSQYYNDLSSQLRGFCMVNPGDIWIGSSYGLYHLTITRSLFSRLHYLYNAESTHTKNSFRGLVMHRSMLIAASEEGGLFRYNPISGEQKHLFPQSGLNRFYALTSVNNSVFFAANTGIYKTDVNGAAPKRIAVLETDHDCWSIYVHSPDSLLLGTSKGLYWLLIPSGKVSPFTRYGRFGELGVTMVNAFKKTGNQLLICTAEGIYIADSGFNIIDKYGHAEHNNRHLSPRSYNHACTDPKGRIWFATNAGLLRVSPDFKTNRLYTTADGLSNNIIYSVAVDRQGMIWMSSDLGIMRFNPENEDIKVYLARHGVSHNEFNRISFCSDSAGKLYFGSLNGLTVVDPDNFAGKGSGQAGLSTAPLAVIDAQKYNSASRKLIDYTADLNRLNTIDLPARQQYFSVRLALLNYSDPQHTIYSYRIEDMEQEWHSQSDNSFNFGYFPYGEHNIHFRARAADGTTAETDRVFTIIAPAPIYLRKWFIALEICLFLLAAGGLYMLRTRSLTNDKQRLEGLVQRRTADLHSLLEQKDILMKETHHRVKNNLQVISALQQMQSSRSADPQVKAALNESQNRVLSIAFIHHNLYQQTDNIKGVEMAIFLKELTTHIADVFSNPGVNISVKQQVDNIFLDIDSAVPLGLIINELLTNSYKYAFNKTDSGSITISLQSPGNGQYSFSYSDSGPGLPPGSDFFSAGTLGLKLVKQLSRQLNGKLTNHNNEGFCFFLDFKDYDTRSKD